MLPRPPAPALAPAPPEIEPPRASSGRIALRIALSIPEGITMEVPDELAERLRHLARGPRTRRGVGGQTNRQIARELWLSPETVKTHLRRTLEHFDLHSKAELRLLLLDLDGDCASHPEGGALRGE